MALALTDDHSTLASTVADFLDRHGSKAAARALLEADEASNAPFHAEAAALGWLGLHVPEAYGGSGYGLEELTVVVEQFGRHLAPGAFVPTVVVSALLSSAGSEASRARYLPGLADGSLCGAFSLSGDAIVSGATVTGSAGVVLGASLADVLLVAVGDDVAIVDARAAGVAVSEPANLDPTRRSGRVSLDGAPAEVLAGAAGLLTDLARTILSAEAVGIAAECTTIAADYARVREQFGRPIAVYQAVKHHCANMLVATELATGAVWDAARASASGGEQFAFTSATAAALAMRAAYDCANLNIQVHGGIGFTWEHDAHLYLRRAAALGAIIDGERAAVDVVDHTRAGVRRTKTIDLPPEAEPIRTAVRTFAESIAGLDPAARLRAMVDSGYAVPHWPTPYGRDAGAVEQLVIEQEFTAAGLKRPDYSITGWVILTLVQHATDDQRARWIKPALDQELIWCQLFSEPDAGSDAAGVKTRATRVDGGWLVNGQKVWTSGAHVARFGLATVRTDPDVPKHQGITTMVIDMQHPGVQVRPLRMPSGGSEFNEVFFDDVFVPDDDVVGPVDGGWTVARATLGNESVSIGSGSGGMTLPAEVVLPGLDAHPERMSGGAGRLGRYASTVHAMGVLNLRSANRAVAGGGPGPEGAVTKLVMSELAHDAASMLAELNGPDGAFIDGPAMIGSSLVLMHRALSIAGGTSEIKRNQIGERILGLPRDPLLK